MKQQAWNHAYGVASLQCRLKQNGIVLHERNLV